MAFMVPEYVWEVLIDESDNPLARRCEWVAVTATKKMLKRSLPGFFSSQSKKRGSCIAPFFKRLGV